MRPLPVSRGDLQPPDGPGVLHLQTGVLESFRTGDGATGHRPVLSHPCNCSSWGSWANTSEPSTPRCRTGPLSSKRSGSISNTRPVRRWRGSSPNPPGEWERLTEFQNPAKTCFDGFQIRRGNFGHALLQALLRDGADLVRYSHHGSSGAVYRDEKRRAGLWGTGQRDHHYCAAPLINDVGGQNQAGTRFADLRTACRVQPNPPDFTAAGHCSTARLYPRKWIRTRVLWQARPRLHSQCRMPARALVLHAKPQRQSFCNITRPIPWGYVSDQLGRKRLR